MNMINQIRQRIARAGTATITTEEFNQLQAEWITRTKMEKDELPASLVEQRVMPACNEECNDDTTSPCMDISEDGFVCIRNIGHEGEHVTCGHSEHAVKVWGQA